MDLHPNDFLGTPDHLFPVPRRTLAVLMAVAQDHFESLDERARDTPRMQMMMLGGGLPPSAMRDYRDQMMRSAIFHLVWQMFHDLTVEDRMVLVKEGRQIIATDPDFVTRKWERADFMRRRRRGPDTPLF
ncbi:MAG: hypothetical protein ACKPEA_04665, partial [Planctomycetota bacterium]